MSSSIPHQTKALITGAKHAEWIPASDLESGDVVLIGVGGVNQTWMRRAMATIIRTMATIIRTNTNGSVVITFTVLHHQDGSPVTDFTETLEDHQSVWRLVDVR